MLGRYYPDVQNLFNELGSYKNVGLGETKGGMVMYQICGFYNK